MTSPGGPHEEEALGRAYDGRLMRRLLAYVRPYAWLVVAAVLALAGSAALQLVGPLLTRRVIDVAIPTRDAGMVVESAVIFVAALVGQFGLGFAETLLTSHLGQRVMRDLRLEVFAHLQSLSITFFDRNPVGRLITRVTSDVEALNEMFTAGVVAGLGDFFTLAVIMVVMVHIDWRLALAAFAVVPFVYLVSRLFQSRVRDAYRELRIRLARINAVLQERITGMRVVQLFGREESEARVFDRANREHLDAQLRSITVYALYFPAIEILTSVALASLLVAGAHRADMQIATVGTLAAFLQFVRRFFQPLQDLAEKYNTLQAAMASSERIFSLLDTERSADRGTAKEDRFDRAQSVGRAEPVAPRPATHTLRLGARGGLTVEFRDVWFAYDLSHMARSSAVHAETAHGGEPEWVLRGVSFTARPGETLALVGHTGAGKTTVVNLLLRFYEPQRGEILISGPDGIRRDIREMPLGELRALIGYVQQDIFLFAGDIASNIRLSAALGDADLVAAAEQVGADRVIRRLPAGYNHELGERGASVSIGERQLLSFARAIAADPALLLLDEATSSVDSEIEADIQRALRTLMRGRTTIAVAHRLSTVLEADEILVLHHGQVRERGSHRELLARGGLYERLYRLQAGLAAGSSRPVGDAGNPLASLPGGG
ncbi:MAG: ABC transporter ATP-binding protein/permease [Gemmatimonadota bacterium]|nr:ABC transporter ATP-binding protein/permease [Gemmatimonadota bacterium]